MESQMLWGKYDESSDIIMESIQKIDVIEKTCFDVVSQVNGVNQYDCAWTGYANQHDRKLYYYVPEGMAVTGVASYYKNRHE